MADKVVTNQASINAAIAANAAAAQARTAATAKANAAQAILQPVAQKAIPGISALTAGINAKIAELSGGGPSTYNPVTGRDISSSQLLQQSKNILGGITPEEISTGNKAAADYQKALADAANIKDVNVPAAAYDYTNTGKNSAYDLLLSQFSLYGLQSLVEPLKALITDDTSSGELTLMLRQTEPYKKRFAANTDRLAKGLTPLSEKEYLGLEDQYQNIMRNYGLPASYYAKGDLGRQEGFEKLLANDVSATELEDRVMTAQSRVINANPEIKQALRSFYPDITDGDILAYTLDPTKALTDIKRKVTAAEIGGAAIGAGLKTSQTAAEGLAAYGVTKGQAQQGYGAIAEFLPTGEKLSQIYKESPYTQTQAEQEIFNLANSAEAAKKRKRLSQLETASFGGSSGAGAGALSRDRAGNYQQYGAPGAGAF